MILSIHVASLPTKKHIFCGDTFLIENLKRIGRNLGDGIEIQVNQVGQRPKRDQNLYRIMLLKKIRMRIWRKVSHTILYPQIDFVPVVLRNMNLFIIVLCFRMANVGVHLTLCKSMSGWKFAPTSMCRESEFPSYRRIEWLWKLQKKLTSCYKQRYNTDMAQCQGTHCLKAGACAS